MVLGLLGLTPYATREHPQWRCECFENYLCELLTFCDLLTPAATPG